MITIDIKAVELVNKKLQYAGVYIRIDINMHIYSHIYMYVYVYTVYVSEEMCHPYMYGLWNTVNHVSPKGMVSASSEISK